MRVIDARALRGGCQCGQCGYRLASGRFVVYACHCLECQKQSASAFALSMPVPRAALSLRGLTATYTRATDSGSVTDCHYCPTCGVRLYHCSARSPDMVTLKAGTLERASELIPVAHLWTSRKQPWLKLPDGVVRFETQPADLRQWRQALLLKT